MSWSRILAMVAFFALAAPAQAQYLRLDGVVLKPCDQTGCEASIVRVVPWEEKQFVESGHLPKAWKDPFVPLNAGEHSLLAELSKALLHRSSTKSESVQFGMVPIVYYFEGHPDTHRPSSLGELRKIAITGSCHIQQYSLTRVEDKAERYGLLDVQCEAKGKKAHSFVGVVMNSGRPVRIYFGEPQAVYYKVPAPTDGQQ